MYTSDLLYLLLLAAIVLSFGAQWKVKSAFAKYAKVRPRSGLTGKQLAEALLHAEGINDVPVQEVAGNLTDHYDPGAMVLRLSESTANSCSVAALGVAAHECGHVMQHRDAYAPLMLRTAAVPVVNIGSQLAWPLFLAGMIFSWEPLLDIGIVLYGLAVAFALITLPVEFNASRRAVAALADRGYLEQDEMPGAKSVLSAAAMTYVASAAVAVLQLLRLLAMSNRRKR